MIKLRRFNKIFHCSFFIFLIGKTSLSISAENAQITPNPPIENIPIIAGIEWTEGVTRTSYRWIVNDIDGTQRESPETFHVNFESRFTPQNGDVLLDSLGAELRSSWFGTGVHIGNGPAQLTYNAVGNISLDSGTVSLWFALDEDITHPIYDNWNRLFEYRIDDNNALYIEFSKDSDIITGVSQNESGYTGAWYLFAPIYQSDWHHLVWTWDTHTHTQNLYLDGKIKCQDSNFEPPIGTSDTFHIGCAYWGSPNGYATIDEFRLYNRALKSYEIKALYLFPDQDIDAVLEPSMFNSGDAIQFIYKTFNGQSWSMESSIGPFSVISHPIVESNLINDVLPVGSTTASFSLETAIPAQCHCDTINVPYNQMTYELQGSGTMDHQFSCPVQINQSYSYFIRCAPDSNPNAPWPFVLQSNTHVLRDYNPQYPRIFSLWWNYDDQINTPSDLAKYDLAVLFWGAVQNPGDVLFEAREQNPNLKALITYNFS
jgi:hypothetical protein